MSDLPVRPVSANPGTPAKDIARSPMRKLMRVLAGLACVVVCVVVIARLGAKFELLGTGTDPSWWGIAWKE